jgi:hypothetical protein
VVTLERKTAWFSQWGAKLDKFFTADISPDYSTRYGVLLDQNRAKTMDSVMTFNRNTIPSSCGMQESSAQRVTSIAGFLM